MHLDAERIQRLLDGELAPDVAASAREHLAACSECRSAVAEAEAEDAEVAGLLRSLDHYGPAVSAETIAARVRPRRSGGARWAAGIALALGAAGIAYAVPASPLRSWMEEARGWLTGDPRPPAPAVSADRPGDPPVSGISVRPGDRFVLVFRATEGRRRALVSLVDAREVSVRAVGGAATFTSELDRLVVDPGAVTDFVVEIPRDAPRVEIRVGGRRILLKEGGAITADASPNPDGIYRLPLTVTGP